MNKFICIGRWSKDIELRYTPSGKAVASCTVAIDDGFGDKKQTDFLPVVMWEKLAESVSQHSGKGRLIAIDGKIKTRSYDANDGSKRYVTEILAQNVRFLDKPGHQQAEQQQEQQDPFADNGTPLDISDQDLPF